jgi:hypothetical protein
MAGTKQGSVNVANITSVRRSERHTTLLGKTRTDTSFTIRKPSLMFSSEVLTELTPSRVFPYNRFGKRILVSWNCIRVCTHQQSPTDFCSTYLKKLQVVPQVKSSSYRWYFVFVFPLPPIVTSGRIGRYSF